MSPFCRLPGRVALGLLAAAGLAAPDPASAVAFLGFRGDGRAPAGTEVQVSWTVDSWTLAGLDESELVLSLDDGVTFPVRVTGRLSPETRTFLWRIPGLPTQHARLALRAGDEETAESERILAISEPFVIPSGEGGGLEELYAVAGEWRTREALEGAPVRPLPRQLESRDADPEVQPDDADADDSDSAPALADAGPVSPPRPLALTPTTAPAPGAPTRPASPSVPLRL